MQIDAPVSHDVWCWAQKLALQRCKKMPGEKWNLICDVHIFDYAFFCWKISSRELAGRQIGQRGWLVDIRGGQKLHNGDKNFILIVRWGPIWMKNLGLWMLYTLNIFSNLSDTSEGLGWQFSRCIKTSVICNLMHLLWDETKKTFNCVLIYMHSNSNTFSPVLPCTMYY